MAMVPGLPIGTGIRTAAMVPAVQMALPSPFSQKAEMVNQTQVFVRIPAVHSLQLPNVITRDFRDMLEQSRDLVAQALDHTGNRPPEWSFINTKVRDILDRFYYDQTKRRPMILPFMVKV